MSSGWLTESFYKRNTGFEPVTPTWKDGMLPLHQFRKMGDFSPSTSFHTDKESIRHNEYYVKSPQRGFAPATIAYKAIILTAKTMGAVKYYK